MKKKMVALLSALLLALLLCACGYDEKETLTLLAVGDADKTVTVNLSDFKEGDTLYTLLQSEKYKDKVNATVDDVTYPDSPMVTAVMGLTADDDAHTYVQIFADDETYWDTSEWGTELEHGGKKYRSTNVGIAQLPLKKGVTYLFKLASW